MDITTTARWGMPSVSRKAVRVVVGTPLVKLVAMVILILVPRASVGHHVAAGAGQALTASPPVVRTFRSTKIKIIIIIIK